MYMTESSGVCATHQCRWGTCHPWCMLSHPLWGCSPPGTHSGSCPQCWCRCVHIGSGCWWRTHQYLDWTQCRDREHSVSQKSLQIQQLTLGLAPLLISAKDTVRSWSEKPGIGRCGKHKPWRHQCQGHGSVIKNKVDGIPGSPVACCRLC